MPLDLIGVFSDDTDGYTYSSEYCLGIFDDIEKARVVAEKAFKENFWNDEDSLSWEDMNLYRVSPEGTKDEDHFIKLEFIEINKER